MKLQSRPFRKKYSPMWLKGVETLKLHCCLHFQKKLLKKGTIKFDMWVTVWFFVSSNSCQCYPGSQGATTSLAPKEVAQWQASFVSSTLVSKHPFCEIGSQLKCNKGDEMPNVMMNFSILWILNQSYLLKMYSPLCLWTWLGLFACKHHTSFCAQFLPLASPLWMDLSELPNSSDLLESAKQCHQPSDSESKGLAQQQGAKTKLTPTKWSWFMTSCEWTTEFHLMFICIFMYFPYQAFSQV